MACSLPAVDINSDTTTDWYHTKALAVHLVLAREALILCGRKHHHKHCDYSGKGIPICTSHCAKLSLDARVHNMQARTLCVHAKA